MVTIRNALPNRRMRRPGAAIALIAPLALLGTAARPPQAERPSAYLFAWTNAPESAYLATIDVGPGSPTRGQTVASLPVGIKNGRAHHTEHELGPTGTLLANLFETGRTFLFDVHDPLSPHVLSWFDGLGPFAHPHSFVRLQSGHILATFQHAAGGDTAGGLIEFTPTGEVVRVSAPADAQYQGFVRPYSLAVVARLDRVVTTGHDMHQGGTTRVVQVWRLSDLELLRTIELPNGPRGVEGTDSGEPRLLADGKTVLVATYRCGLFRLTHLDRPSPDVRLVHDFGGDDCALPVLIDSFWIQTVPPRSIVTLDVSRPEPREVGLLQLAAGDSPHWMAREPEGRRLAITGVEGLLGRILIARVARDGQVTLDPGFVDAEGRPGIKMARGVPHGVVFSRP